MCVGHISRAPPFYSNNRHILIWWWFRKRRASVDTRHHHHLEGRESILGIRWMHTIRSHNHIVTPPHHDPYTLLSSCKTCDPLSLSLSGKSDWIPPHNHTWWSSSSLEKRVYLTVPWKGGKTSNPNSNKVSKLYNHIKRRGGIRGVVDVDWRILIWLSFKKRERESCGRKNCRRTGLKSLALSPSFSLIWTEWVILCLNHGDIMMTTTVSRQVKQNTLEYFHLIFRRRWWHDIISSCVICVESKSTPPTDTNFFSSFHPKLELLSLSVPIRFVCEF